MSRIIQVLIFEDDKLERLFCSKSLKIESKMSELSSLITTICSPILFLSQTLGVATLSELDCELSRRFMENVPMNSVNCLELFSQLDDHSSSSDQCSTSGLVRSDDKIPTLVHFSAKYGLVLLTKKLLKLPAVENALNMRNVDGHTPSELALSSSHPEIATLIEDSRNVDSARSSQARNGLAISALNTRGQNLPLIAVNKSYELAVPQDVDRLTSNDNDNGKAKGKEAEAEEYLEDDDDITNREVQKLRTPSPRSHTSSVSTGSKIYDELKNMSLIQSEHEYVNCGVNQSQRIYANELSRPQHDLLRIIDDFQVICGVLSARDVTLLEKKIREWTLSTSRRASYEAAVGHSTNNSTSGLNSTGDRKTKRLSKFMAERNKWRTFFTFPKITRSVDSSKETSSSSSAELKVRYCSVKLVGTSSGLSLFERLSN